MAPTRLRLAGTQRAPCSYGLRVMPTFPGPAALGRGVIILPERQPPAACDGWQRVVIDDEAVRDPGHAAEQLRRLWQERRPCVVVLAVDPAELRAPETCGREVFELGPGFGFPREALQYFAWSNNYDLRSSEPIWWHARRAGRLGASETGPADVVLADGTPAWCDGGPRQPLELGDGSVVVHRESIEAGSLLPDRLLGVTADLAPDQLAAVAHGGGPARVIAPAGSGKTRVLTERVRHLLADRGVTPSSVTVVAFNKRAADELKERTAGLPAHIRTLNALGLAVVNGWPPFAATGRPRQVIEESEVRRILESLLTVRRQVNTDPYAAYIEALSMIRLGLVAPEVAEEAIPDAAGVAGIFAGYRETLAERGLLDFDEQIYAAIELMCRDPALRSQNQRVARHLLVDEFQDLTPAHLLLLRLLAAPTHDVFGVGDDDQVIYSYAGADPDFLISFGRYFPGASEYALETNYRCPPGIVEGARTLLSHNRRRVPKSIQSAAGREGVAGDVRVVREPSQGASLCASGQISDWVKGGAGFSDIAVLARVNASLLPMQVLLSESGVPCTAPLGKAVLNRTGTRTALAYLRIGADPSLISRLDVSETIRRPSRRIARNVVEMLQKRETTSLSEIRRLARALSGADVEKLEMYADDLERVAKLVSDGTTASALRAIRLDIGLGGAMDALDLSRREVDRSTHLDDLAALEQVAELHPEAASFESWLGEVLSRPGDTRGVTLSTVHRVKGREWPHVIVYGADHGLFPHRLASDAEEERRVFHVGITRACVSAVIIADSQSPSRFCDELSRVWVPPAVADIPAVAAAGGRRDALDSYSGRPRADRLRPREREAKPAVMPVDHALEEAIAALKAWRTSTAGRDKVPAYIVLSDVHLVGIATAMPTSLAALACCRGIGPAKLDRYGDEILAAIEGLSARRGQSEDQSLAKASDPLAFGSP